jgi:predicted dienelactone hydrolase
MSYNPFTRGQYPVGVRTIELRDDTLAVTQVVEIWYPATASYRGQDIDPATRDRFTFAPEMPGFSQHAVRDAEPAVGRFPLAMHNHGVYGHRRVATILCTHLASHGYIVASNDVPGNTTADLMQDAIAQRRGEPGTLTPVIEVNRRRWAYASSVIESLVRGEDRALSDRIDGARVGAFGQSAGGWTSIGLNSINRRIAATFAMEPLWGVRSRLPGVAEMASWLRFNDGGRSVPTFVLAGEVDPLIILQDLRELYAKLPAPKRFASLRAAGHWHFSDNAEVAHEMFRKMYLTSFPDDTFDTRKLGEDMRPFSELCPEKDAADTMRALCLAHMDANLKQNGDAQTFLDDDLTGTFARRGIFLDEVASAATPSFVAV